MTQEKGNLIISLDFELYWGMRDKKTLEECKESMLGARTVVPYILRLFRKYKIHATWAVVGFLFFKTYDELIKGLPAKKPNYAKKNLSPYEYIQNIGNNEIEDPFHYAASLIKLIKSFPYQEIASHTFSHYYCLEKGQNMDTFKADLKAATIIAKKYQVNLESLVFPRNQLNSKYLAIIKEMGIKAYRGNASSWIHRSKNQKHKSTLNKGLRLIDSYLNISGHNSYSLQSTGKHIPYNIPSSRFLYWYSNRLKILEPLRLRRILSDLTYAAKRGLIYHLWWHSHNFGINIKENMSFLKRVLDHYLNLKKVYGMESLNMRELADRINKTVN